MLKKCSFIGLGPMGGAILHTLTKSTISNCHAFDLNPSCFSEERTYKNSSKSWKITDSCQLTKNLEECVEESEIIFTCLPNSNIVHSVLKQIKPHISAKYWIDFTSGHFKTSQDCGEELSQIGTQFLDVGVSGGPDGAAAGTLSIMVGGSDEAYEQVQPILRTLGTPILCGKTGSGHAVKCINNILNTTHLMAAAEGLAALTKLGVDPEKALLCINNGSGASKQTLERIPDHVLTRKFFYNFKLGLMLKDVNLANQLLQENYPENYSSILQQTKICLEQSVENQGGEVDYTECTKYFEELANCEIRPHKKDN